MKNTNIRKHNHKTMFLSIFGDSVSFFLSEYFNDIYCFMICIYFIQIATLILNLHIKSITFRIIYPIKEIEIDILGLSSKNSKDRFNNLFIVWKNPH
jgi:hypothetical protein